MPFRNYFLMIYNSLKNSNILNYAAQLSYGLTLAFLPILMLFNFSIQFLSYTSEVQARIFDFISLFFPKEVSNLILPTLIDNNYNPLSDVNSLTTNLTLIIFLLYASTRLIRSFSIISTRVLGYKVERNFIVLWIIAFRNFILIIIYLIFVIIFHYALQTVIIHTPIIHIPGLTNYENPFFEWFTYIYIFAAGFFLLNCCLCYLPERRLKFRSTIPGTVVTLLGWSLLIFLHKLVSDFLDYEGWSIIVSQGLTILITIYLISLILIAGILFNKIIARINHTRMLERGSKKYV